MSTLQTPAQLQDRARQVLGTTALAWGLRRLFFAI
jgi:hypothetical protein